MTETKAQELSSPNYLAISFIYTVLLTLSTFGFTWAIYPLIVLMLFVSVLLALAAAFVLNKDLFDMKDTTKKYARDIRYQLFAQAIYIICVYHVYTSGFLFLAGCFTFVAITGLFGSLFYILMPKKGK